MALQPRFAKHTISSLLKQKREVDPVFQGAGQKDGLEIWWIDSWGLQAVPEPRKSYGDFFTGHSFIVLKTTALKNGRSFRHDIHCWLGKDTSQDEARTAAIKTAELDAALGTGRAVQYREAQGNETEKFLSYFKEPCIIPEEIGALSGFSHTEANNTNHGGIAAVEDGKLMADHNNGVSLPCITPEEVGVASEDGRLMVDDNNGVSLPMDVIWEILQRARLPVKSLCRFRSVSKTWSALISSPTFLARAEPLLVLMSSYGPSYGGALHLQLMDMEGNMVPKVGLWNLLQKFQAEFNLRFHLSGHFQRGCSDDLVCLKCPTVTCLANLATRERIVVDEPSDLAYIKYIGVGRAAKSGVHKVIRKSCCLPDHDDTWEILRLGDGAAAKWRPTQPAPIEPADIVSCDQDGITIGGVVHYLSKGNAKILCFDLEREEWTVINSAPLVVGHWRWLISLAELNGALCMIQEKWTPVHRMVHLWLVTDSTKGIWANPYTLHLDSDLSSFIPLRMISPGGKLLFYDYHYYLCRHTVMTFPLLQVYDPRSGKCTRVAKAPPNLIGKIGFCSL